MYCLLRYARLNRARLFVPEMRMCLDSYLIGG